MRDVRDVRDEDGSGRSPVASFENLIAWQKARALASAIYAATRDTELHHDRDLSRQMRRAAVSIMANIAEGNERGGTAEYFAFLSIARASCAELRSHLYLAGDVGYLDPSCVGSLMAQAAEVARLTGGLRAAIARRKGSSR